MADKDEAEGVALMPTPPRTGRPRLAKSIELLVVEIRGLMLDVESAESNLGKKRLVAGQRLLELRHRVEAGEAGDASWWDFYDQHLAQFRTRKDAERLMRMAASDGAEAAFEAERTEARERMQKHRAAQPWGIGGKKIEAKAVEWNIGGKKIEARKVELVKLERTFAPTSMT